MKTCPKCGAEADGIFCIHCGAAVNAETATPAEPAAPAAPAADFPQKTFTTAEPYTAPAAPVVPQQPTYTAPATPVTPQQPYGGYQTPYYPPAAPQEKPVSVGGWIGRSLIPCIPGIGWLIYLIMLFVWMGDKTKEASFRNWAKAQLVVMGIVVGLAILLIFVLGVSVGEIVNEFTYQ